MPLNPLDPSTEVMPHQVVPAFSTTTSYNRPGLPTPPAGWGKDVGTGCIKAPDTSC